MMSAEGWELVAAMEPDAGKLAETGAAAGLGEDQLFQDEAGLYGTHRPDLVFVHSPLGFHVENCRRALEAGCHVCCQKPFVGNPADGRALVEIAAQAGRWISVGQTARLGDVSLLIDRVIREGLIGAPAFGHHTVYRNRMINASSYTRGESWPVIHATGIHNVDIYRMWFQSRVAKVSIRGIDCDWNPYQDPGAVTGWLEMESGPVITFMHSFVSKVPLDPKRHPYEDNMIQGSEGALHWNGPWDRGPVELLRGDADSPEQIMGNRNDFPVVMTRLMDSLAASIRDGAPVFCPADDNLWSLAAMFAAQQSAERGGEVVDVLALGEGVLSL